MTMTSITTKRLVPADYTIACVCPMGIELAPVEGMLDEIHDSIPLGRDRNVYTFGRLGAHNVAITVMPEIGNNAAATVGTQLRNDLPSVRFGLLVGIGGGVPGDVDVRLGDVVVSKATNIHGGVVQYDLGRRLKGGQFERTGMLNKPPTVLSASVQRLQARYAREGSHIQSYLAEMAQKYPKMRNQCSKPIAARDDLFEMTYEHRTGTTCDECNGERIIERPVRESEEPYVHYGTIGSANVVIRDAILRDELRKDMDIICVEMEAAGLLNDVPCIVIRGICDYADSHKSKEWQPYAAAVAAAYMKELLLIIPSNPVELLATPANIPICKRAHPDEDQENAVEISETDSDILSSLAFPKMRDRRLNVAEPHANTCLWILDLPEYQAWCSRPRGLLWIKGKPGAGKSTMMSFLYDRIKRRSYEDTDVSLEFFFSGRGLELQKTFIGMLRSLLNQLFQQDLNIRPLVRRYYTEKCTAFGKRTATWDWQQRELEGLLRDSIIEVAQRRMVQVFVDALDETGAIAARAIAEYFHTINDRVTTTSAMAKIYISCRHFPIVATYKGLDISLEEHNRADIAAYVAHYFDRLAPLYLHSDEDLTLLTRIQSELVQRAAGVFQWISLVMPMIEDGISSGFSLSEIQQQVRHIPEAVGDVYWHILHNVISRQNLPQSFLLFQWVCLAEWPLSIAELRYALATNDSKPKSHYLRDTGSGVAVETVKSDQAMKQRVTILSGGLVEVVNQQVQVGHQTVKEYLMQDGFRQLLSLCASPHSIFAPGEIDLPSAEDSDIVIQKCQAKLYWSCLKYLAAEMALPRYEHLKHQHERTDLWNHREMIIRVSPFMRYAVKNVFLHARRAGKHRKYHLAEEARLIESVRCFWVAMAVIFGGHLPLLSDSYLQRPEYGASTMHIAAGAGLSDLVVYLLEGNADIDQRDDEGNAAVHVAVLEGNQDVMEILFDAGFSITTKNDVGETPLSLAIARGHSSLIDWLLARGAGAGQNLDDAQEPALHVACAEGYTDIVLVLLEAGIDYDSRDEDDTSALQRACYGGHEDIVQILLDRGADVNIEGGAYGSAVQAAAYKGYEEIVRWLLSANADVNIGGGRFESALQAASYMGHHCIVEMLLSHGANVNAKGGEFGTPLQAASLNHDVKIVQLLLETGSDVQLISGWYGTALQAASHGGDELIVKMLLDHGAEVNTEGGRFGTPLQAACYKGHDSVVSVLLCNGAEINTTSGEFGNALNAALAGGMAHIVVMLITAGADVNAHTPANRFHDALQAASYMGHEDLVQTLVHAGAEINAQGGQYHSALQAAARQGQEQVVRMLINMGAHVNALGGTLGNAVCAAAANGYHNVVQMLVDSGADVNVDGVDYGKAYQAASTQIQHELQPHPSTGHQDYEAVLQLLLDAGAHVDASDFGLMPVSGVK